MQKIDMNFNLRLNIKTNITRFRNADHAFIIGIYDTIFHFWLP